VNLWFWANCSIKPTANARGSTPVLDVILPTSK
jgi:hypothetical protein